MGLISAQRIRGFVICQGNKNQKTQPALDFLILVLLPKELTNCCQDSVSNYGRQTVKISTNCVIAFPFFFFFF